MKKNPDVFTTIEIAKICNITNHDKVKNLIDEGKLTAFKVPTSNNRLLVTRKNLEKFIKENGYLDLDLALIDLQKKEPNMKRFTKPKNKHN